MKPWTLLRIASIVSLLFFVGHSLGAPWTPARGDQDLLILGAMQSHRFDVMGASRSYWDFYVAFGWSISVYLFAQSVLLWQLASRSKIDANGVRPSVAVFLLSTVLTGAIACRFIAAPPVAFSIVLAVVLALALWSCRRPSVVFEAPVEGAQATR